jgi:hypothetical protein
MAINNIQDLALALKGAASGLTMAQIKALDENSALCQMPANAVQVIKAAGYPLTITTDGQAMPNTKSAHK